MFELDRKPLNQSASIYMEELGSMELKLMY